MAGVRGSLRVVDGGGDRAGKSPLEAGYDHFRLDRMGNRASLNTLVWYDHMIRPFLAWADEEGIRRFEDLKVERLRHYRAHRSQMGRIGRAVGVHLVVCTQRPDADTVTPQLRAQLPATVAIHCVNDTNSQVLLDNSAAADLAPRPGRAIWQCDRQVEVQRPMLEKAEAAALLMRRYGGGERVNTFRAGGGGRPVDRRRFSRRRCGVRPAGTGAVIGARYVQGGCEMAELRVLSSGVDTLHLSVRGTVRPDLWTELDAARSAAGDDDQEPVELGQTGQAFNVQPHGWKFFPLWLRSSDYELMLGRSERFPAAVVQLHSAYLDSMGVRAAVRLVESTLRAAVVVGAVEPTVSRIDLYADVQGWPLRVEDMRRFVSRARGRGGRPLAEEEGARHEEGCRGSAGAATGRAGSR